MTAPQVDMSRVKEIIKRYPQDQTSSIQVLQDIHREFNYLPEDAFKEVSAALGVPLSRLFGIATFYKAFSLEPKGKTIIKVCLGTACHVRGGSLLVEELERILRVKPGKATPDFKYSFETVNCVGACAMAPVLIVGEDYHGNVKATRIGKLLKKGGDDDEN